MIFFDKRTVFYEQKINSLDQKPQFTFLSSEVGVGGRYTDTREKPSPGEIETHFLRKSLVINKQLYRISEFEQIFSQVREMTGYLENLIPNKI